MTAASASTTNPQKSAEISLRENNMAPEQIKQELHKIDLALRPQAVFLHPDDYMEIMQAIPDIEEKVLVINTRAINKGYAIMMDRKCLEVFIDTL